MKTSIINAGVIGLILVGCSAEVDPAARRKTELSYVRGQIKLGQPLAPHDNGSVIEAHKVESTDMWKIIWENGMGEVRAVLASRQYDSGEHIAVCVGDFPEGVGHWMTIIVPCYGP